ncbi:MAG TPA: major capsid protein, partial [Allocoleopsis sp.]
MAVTRISDIIVPEIFAPYVIQRTADKSALWQSGLIVQNEETNRIANGGGTTANMPFFNDLTGTSEVLSETTPLSVNPIGASKDICVINHRGKAWGANDLAKAKSGDDPMGAIGELVSTWWARDMQTTLINILKGAFASTTMASEHVLNLSIADGNAATSANLISSDATINALAKLGDALDAISAIAMHSDIYYALLRQDVIDFEQPSQQGEIIQRYKGRTVIVDDALPKVAGATSGYVYSTYLFGAGAIGYGEGDPYDAAVETDRDVLQGDSYLVNRRCFVMHPLGVKWQGTAAGASPSNAEFAI